MYLRDTKLLLTEHKAFGPRLSQYGPGRCVQKRAGASLSDLGKLG